MKTTKSIVVACVLAASLAGACGRGDGGSGGSSQTGVGVTKEACPQAVNKNHGCIYLGSISDLTSGPFKALAVPITDAQKAFWARVNKQGGIGGYDIDVTTYVRDNKYNPEVHNQVYQEIKGKVLALAQTLGSPTTAAIIGDLRSSKVVSVPASWTSGWAFENVILASGTNYCFESMNSVDYAVDKFGTKSVMAVHYAGDYGDDAAAGTKLAAQARNLTFKDVQTASGQDNQAGAIDAVVTGAPDLVIITTGPTDAAVIIGQAAARGYRGKFIGTSPTWNPGLLASPAAPAIKALYLQSGPWKSFVTDSPGHRAMREAIGQVQANDGYTSGWALSYPLKAALEQAAKDGKLNREGLFAAVKKLDKVDYEGMLPSGAGNFTGNPNTAAFRQSVISKPDDTAPAGVSLVQDFFVGPSAKAHNFTKPCYDLK